MKTLILCVLSFAFGLIVMAVLSSYSSKVWSYNQLARSREAMMSMAYKTYGEGHFQEAASFARGANMIAGMPDQQWHLTDPFYDSMFRFFGAFDGIHVNKNYNAYVVAYLYHLSGDDAQAQPYYALAGESGMSKNKVDDSAKIFLDGMSAGKK
jgi:hypothetical protein